MEEEEREAQSAKLQELIRRGTPEDLQEANRLMKVMAGYDTRSKTDYRAKAAEDVGKIQAKARLLEERLEAFRPGDKMQDGDVFSELAAALQSAQPKIQKMCEEESDDHEAVARLLEINDSIHRTVERYKLMKKGDLEGAAKVAAGHPPPSQSGTSSSAANELSLIDFDGDATQSNGSNGASSSQAGGLENDLLGLDISGQSSTFGQGGGIALGFGANQSKLRKPDSSYARQLTDLLFNRHPRARAAFVSDPGQHCQGRRPERDAAPLFPVCLLLVSSSVPVRHASAQLPPAATGATASGRLQRLCLGLLRRPSSRAAARVRVQRRRRVELYLGAAGGTARAGQAPGAPGSRQQLQPKDRVPGQEGHGGYQLDQHCVCLFKQHCAAHYRATLSTRRHKGNLSIPLSLPCFQFTNLVFLHSMFAGLRTPAQAPDRPLPRPQAEPRRDARSRRLAHRQPQPARRVRQAALARVVQGRRGGQE